VGREGEEKIENPSGKSWSINATEKFLRCRHVLVASPKTFSCMWCSILCVSFLRTHVYLPSSTFDACLA
jgi:hypothetical protein